MTVSKEVIFADLNNLKVVIMTLEKYAEYFVFTEKEAFSSLDKYGFLERKLIRKGSKAVSYTHLTLPTMATV